MDFTGYVAANSGALSAIENSTIELFVNGLDSLRRNGKTLWVAGNGGSAATASHTVADLTKTITSSGDSGLRSIAISEMVSLQTAFANDESFEQAMSRTIQMVGSEGDGLLVISVSGLSPNLIAAANEAKAKGLTLFSLVGSRGVSLARDSDFAILVPSEDYQIVENAHMALIHWFVKALQ